MSKRTLDNFFSPATKRLRVSPPPLSRSSAKQVEKTTTTRQLSPPAPASSSTVYSHHKAYPHPIAHLPPDLITDLTALITTTDGTSITNQPHLDLLHFQPFIPRPLATELFNHLRSSLPFYRVRYTITRFGKETIINTPRFTTVFGVDDTSLFDPPECPTTPDSTVQVIDAANKKPVHPQKYKATPRPIPQPLALLKQITEAVTDTSYNFCLVNYYASGSDSISFHSDDERFLGPEPAIASFSLGASRDFLMKHKPPPSPATNGNAAATATDAAGAKTYPGTTPLKFPLKSGDMILMRGETQAHWLHSIPKRSGKAAEAEAASAEGRRRQGRINITFRKAMVPGGTENYYRYNVGDGGVYRWDERLGEMVAWKGERST